MSDGLEDGLERESASIRRFAVRDGLQYAQETDTVFLGFGLTDSMRESEIFLANWREHRELS